MRLVQQASNQAVHGRQAVPVEEGKLVRAQARARDAPRLLLGGADVPAEGVARRRGLEGRPRAAGRGRRGRRAAKGTRSARGEARGGRRARARAAEGARRARRRDAAPARGADRGPHGGRAGPGHPRLRRGHDAAAPDRRRASARRLAARPAARPGVRGHRHAEQDGRRLRGLRAVGRRRAAARGRRGQALDVRPDRRPAAGEALRRSARAHARAASADLLHQRLRPPPLGRRRVPAPPGRRLLREGRAGAADRAARAADRAVGRRRERRHRRALLPEARDRQRARALRQRTQEGAARHGHRHRQDPHGDRARRRPAARRSGQARAVPGRPEVARAPGRQRVQGAAAGVEPGQPRDRQAHRRARLRVHLPDDDGADRPERRRRGALRRRPLRPDRHRRGPPLGVPEVRRDLRILRCPARRAHRHAERGDRPEHLRAVRARGGRADRRLRAGDRGQGRLSRATECLPGRHALPARRHRLRRAVRRGEAALGGD